MGSRVLGRLFETALRTWLGVGAYALLPLLAGAAHLIEVHLVDAPATDAVRAATGLAFDWFGILDLDLSQRALAGLAGYYLLVFLAFLGWTPGLIAATGDTRLLKRTLLCYPILYLLALPGFLLFPSTNPYVRAAAPSPFDAISPGLDRAYYLLTTPDNTFPSLHVAFTLVLATALWRAWPTWRLSTATHAALLTLSVVLVRVHYWQDVLGGLAIAILAWKLAGAALDGRIGAALDRWSARIELRVRFLAMRSTQVERT